MEWLGPIALIAVAFINAGSLYYMRKLEKNTNSMKDRLVNLTAVESFARGVLSETEKEK